MKFDYVPLTDGDEPPVIYRPFLDIKLSKRGSQVIEVKGLLDSGADIILFPLNQEDEDILEKKMMEIADLSGETIMEIFKSKFGKTN